MAGHIIFGHTPSHLNCVKFGTVWGQQKHVVAMGLCDQLNLAHTCNKSFVTEVKVSLILYKIMLILRFSVKHVW